MATYYELLKHPKWQKKRLEILASSNFECRNCGDGDSTLHVHHGAYLKGLKPWEYDDDMYHVLCEECHNDASGNQQDVYRSLAKISPHYYEFIGAILDIYGNGDDAKHMYRALFAFAGLSGVPFFDSMISKLEKYIQYENSKSK